VTKVFASFFKKKRFLFCKKETKNAYP